MEAEYHAYGTAIGLCQPPCKHLWDDRDIVSHVLLQIGMVCSDIRNPKLFGDRVGGIDHERGNLRMYDIQTQLPEKLMKNVLGSPWF